MLMNIVIFCTFILTVHCGNFPRYLTKCRLSDPYLDNCLAEQTNIMLSYISNGDENLGVVSWNIMTFPTVEFQVNEYFNISLHKCRGVGFDTVHTKNFTMNHKFQTFEIVVTTRNYTLICTYEATGKLIRKHFDDIGEIQIGFINPVSNIRFDYDIQYMNGMNYYQVSNANFDITNINLNIRMRNYDGNIFSQAQELNELWDRNPEYFERNFIATIKKILPFRHKTFVNNILSQISADQLFDP